MWRALSFIVLAIFMLFIIVWMLFVSHFPYVSYIIFVATLCILSLALAFFFVVSRDKRNEVLRTLDPNTKYQVVCRVHDVTGHEHIMSLIDLTTKAELIACIHGLYPPNGFWEKKTPEGTFVLISEKHEPKPSLDKPIWGWHTGGGTHEVV
ncbi:MAG: hypothetical protein M0P64_02800 [Candidatus Pacebacteria bacterium]|jgi:hypothetical protein|nr:hypothetical protein [Candidatus Paceibacterota bacterium]